MHVSPSDPGCIDWMRAYENGSYSHYAEPRHATEAQSSEAIDIIRTYSEGWL